MISGIDREIFEKKLTLIDVLFQHMDMEELQRAADAHIIVDKLAGVPQQFGPLRQMFIEHELMSADINALRMEIISFKGDFRMLIEAVDRPYSTTSQMSNIKSRYQVY
jgi:hypothetical protein